MRKKVISYLLSLSMLIAVFTFAPSTVLANDGGGVPAPDVVVDELVIEDAIAPINGEAPKTTITETEQYTGTIAWDENPEIFEPNTNYTAIITLTAKDGYTFTGVAENAFKAPCAKSATNAADTGVITVTFKSPRNGYITDGNGIMAYRYYNDYYTFDIQGTYNGEWKRTTYSNDGYRTFFKFENEALSDIAITSASPVDVGNNVTLKVEPKFYHEGRFLRIVYTLHNSGSETRTVYFGSHADTQIGNNDCAPITKLDDDRGFKMIEGDNLAQFTFFGKGTVGVTDVNTYWFGYYGDRRTYLFNQVVDNSLSNTDSGMAYSWKDKTLAPGQTRTFSVLIGIGDAQSGVNVPIGVNFDSQGGSDVYAVTVDMAGDTITAPTDPTRSGYTFAGWYTDEECTNQFDFTTPIDATITLYAKWTQNVVPSGGGSSSPTKYPVTDTNKEDEEPGGQTELSNERAEAGDIVTITVTPDNGYENSIPTVRDKNGDLVDVTDNGDGTYSFKMPNGEVIVDTEFEKIDYFDDVERTDWYDEASWYCAANGLMVGTEERQFDGHVGTSRAMFVTVLYRLSNSEDDFESLFDDVESDKWYSKAIAWAERNKIVEGYGDGRFGPEDELTREQMVAILYRYCVFMNYDVSNLDDLSEFTDADKVSEWALEAMMWAIGNEILKGLSDDTISPETGAIRAHFAAMIQRFCTGFVK